MIDCPGSSTPLSLLRQTLSLTTRKHKNKQHAPDNHLGIKSVLKNVSNSKTGMEKATLPLKNHGSDFQI